MNSNWVYSIHDMHPIERREEGREEEREKKKRVDGRRWLWWSSSHASDILVTAVSPENIGLIFFLYITFVNS